MTADLRRRLLLLAAALFTGWAMWQVREADEPASRPTLAKRAGSTASVANSLPAPLAAISLPERSKTTEPVRDLFQLPQTPAPAVVHDPTPTAPALPFSYLGGISETGATQVFLSDGARTLVAKAGTRLAGGWLLETVEPGRLVFNYEALQHRQELATGGHR